jgi:deoxyribose-phosphate aldolase
MDEQLIERLVDEVVRRVTAEAVRPGAAGSASDCGCPVTTAEATEAAARQLLGTGACRVGCTDPKSLRCEDLAPYIDHTLLKPGATESEIEKLCDEARRHRFASVCVNTSYTELCARLLAGSGVMVCSVVGFPLGAMSTEAKAFETRDAIRHGADEVDMVINVGKLKSGDFAYVCDDIRAVVQAAAGRTVKVIIETALLTDEEKVAACVLAKAAGAHFVKTSTGFGPGGATAEDVALMRRTVGDRMGVKASGGIRDCQTAIQMVESGANRIGASASVAIVKGQESKSSY